jgi:hypothetical protein
MQLRGKKYTMVLTLTLVSSWCVPEKGYAGILDCFKCCKRRPVKDQAEICQKSQTVTLEQDEHRAVTLEQDDYRAVTLEQDDYRAVTLEQDEHQGISTPRRRSKRLEEKRNQYSQKQVNSSTSPTKRGPLKGWNTLTKTQKSLTASDQEHPHNE